MLYKFSDIFFALFLSVLEEQGGSGGGKGGGGGVKGVVRGEEGVKGVGEGVKRGLMREMVLKER